MAAAALLAVPWAAGAATGAPAVAAAEDPAAQALLADANGFWIQEIRALKAGSYDLAKLSLFSGSLKGSTCGTQGALTGPFYCPADEQIYLDRTFLRAVDQRAPGVGRFALAYLIGHEIGHHIQLLDGTTVQVQQARSRSSPQLSSRLWMTQELQADCFAGLWLHSAEAHGKLKGVDPDRMLEAVAAVSAQTQAHLPAGTVMPDPVLTYGSAAQRSKWLRLGLAGGGIQTCNTFTAAASGQL